MESYQAKDLLPKMITAEPVRTKNGQLVVNQGVTLTKQLIAKIHFYNIESVVVEDFNKDQSTTQTDTAEGETEKEVDFFTHNSLLHYEQKTGAQNKGAVAEPSYSQKVKKSAEFQQFQLNFTFGANDLKVILDSIIAGKPLDTKDMLTKVLSLIKSDQTSIEFFDMLHNLRSVNDSIYAHCLNVGLIARMIGIWLKLPTEDIDCITVAGLLHDIGKIRIPSDILNKTDKLTEEEFAVIRKHPQFSYDILKNQNLDQHILNAALMHHERCDGSGYPNNLSANEIDDYAIIIAIADVYDAMTAARTYRAPLCPFQVIAEFENDGLQKYKPKYILTFLEHIATTYQNNRVILSNGETAKIVFLNHQVYSKPLVQLDDGSCIDLNQSNLFIKAII